MNLTNTTTAIIPNVLPHALPIALPAWPTPLPGPVSERLPKAWPSPSVHIWP